jgi:hypothetical protein
MKEFLKDLYSSLPAPANLGVRLAIWIVGLSPVFKRRRLMGFDRLVPEERIRLLSELSSSESYTVRQMVMILKMNGALSHAATTRFHEEMGTAR